MNSDDLAYRMANVVPRYFLTPLVRIMGYRGKLRDIYLTSDL
jgi:hypothetical protein